MYLEWTKHLKDPQDKSDFEQQILSARPVLERLKTILQETENAIDRSEVNIKVYDTPNWAERQAHKNGTREALWFLKTLVDLDQQKGPK